jgi:uncharacterized membrane protein
MAAAARRFGAVLLVAAALGYEMLVHLASSSPDAKPALVVPLAGLPHAAIYVFLLWLFGRTLRPGREALITAVARRFHGSIPRFIEAYTRRLTIAWCVFFAAQLVLSALLLAFASLDTWSLFVNVLNLPLLAAMFAGDYAYRVLRFPGYPHASIVQSIQAFARHVRVS